MALVSKTANRSLINSSQWRMLVGTSAISFAAMALVGPANAQDVELAASVAVENSEDDNPAVIVVTARKRAESTLKVPETVTAFSEASLERANIQDIDDVGLAVPNLQLSTRTDGFPNVTVRGLGGFGNTQGVGFYLDDVQLYADASSRFGDLQRIEVLKGPQGILYGGSNIGGAVKFVSKRPEPGAFYGEISARAGTDNYFDGEVELNLPLGKNWALKVFGFAETDDGYLINPRTPRQNGRRAGADEDIAKREQYGARVSLFGEVGDAEVYLTARYNELKSANNPWIRELDGNFRYSRLVDTSYNPRNERETLGLTGHIDIPVGDLTIQSITSYSETKSRRETDLDIQPEFVLDLFRPEDFNSFTQELRLSSDDSGPFIWQVGGYYSKIDRDLDSVLIIREAFCYLDPGTCPPLSQNDDTILAEVPFEVSRRKREQIAGFVNMSYKFGGGFELGGGLRIDRTSSRRDNLDTGLSGNAEETVVLGRGSLSWSSPDDRSLVYANFSQGFEPADFSLTNLTGAGSLLGYAKETANQIEVGYKGRLLDDALIFTIAGFYIDYRDRQFELQAVDPATGGFVEGVVNVGDSTQKGIEFDFSWRLADRFTFSGGAGYIDAKWKDGVISHVSGLDLSGVQPPNVSKWSASAALEYEGDIGGGEFFVRAQGRYKGASTTNAQFFDTPGDDYPIFKNPSYLVADISTGVEFGPFKAGLALENLFDKRYFNDVQEFPNFAGTQGEPGNIVIGTLGQVRRFMALVSFQF